MHRAAGARRAPRAEIPLVERVVGGLPRERIDHHLSPERELQILEGDRGLVQRLAIKLHHALRIDPPEHVPVLGILAGEVDADDLVPLVAQDGPLTILILPTPRPVRPEQDPLSLAAAADLIRQRGARELAPAVVKPVSASDQQSVSDRLEK